MPPCANTPDRRLTRTDERSQASCPGLAPPIPQRQATCPLSEPPGLAACAAVTDRSRSGRSCSCPRPGQQPPPGMPAWAAHPAPAHQRRRAAGRAGGPQGRAPWTAQVRSGHAAAHSTSFSRPEQPGGRGPSARLAALLPGWIRLHRVRGRAGSTPIITCRHQHAPSRHHQEWEHLARAWRRSRSAFCSYLF